MEFDNETCVNINLLTKYERYRITTGSISVPTRFSRFELSKLVNEALELETPVPFDFIVEGKLLRISLSEYMSGHNISLESTLELQYVPIIGKPEEQSSENLPDWVSGIACNGNTYVAGCYDGTLHMYNMDDTLICQQNAHTKPIKHVDCATIDGKTIIASVSLDNTMKLFSIGDKFSKEVAICKGHDSHVMCCKMWGEGGLVVSSAWNGSILVWDVKKMKEDNSLEIEPVHMLNESMEGITALGWEHDHVNGNKVINDLDVNKQNDIIASAHPDGVVRLWDQRQEKANILCFLSRHQFTSSVSWHPTNANTLVSTTYDGCVCVYDIRSSYPIHVAEMIHNGKILCCAWKNDTQLLTGGDDNKMKRLSVESK